MENEQPEFADANAPPDPPRPINNNNRAMLNKDAQPARCTIGDFGAQTGITIYQESDVSLSMANTTAIPILGKIHTVPVRNGNHIVRTDFHVVDSRGNRSASIILGRPFLATVGAVIDLPSKRATFTHIGLFCISIAVPIEFSLHEATLDNKSKRKPDLRRKRDYKGKKAATKANEEIVVKGPDIKARGEASRSCNSNVENTPQSIAPTRQQ